MKRVFLVVLVTGAMVFALEASVQQLRADAGQLCADYYCECDFGCQHLGDGHPKCDMCMSLADHRCALRVPEGE